MSRNVTVMSHHCSFSLNLIASWDIKTYLVIQGETTEDSERRKAECLVQLAQMPTPEDMVEHTGHESLTSDTESSASVSISQGTSFVLKFSSSF